ncbi:MULTISPECIES: pyridoxamine 5'-phosphate oxidase [unclassified Devosia]|uniref:pyridoxamine 5'-phosphate oxidase n=1 Tax=unclassified Devosia TaxID=196773 RepID=UPI00086CA1DF|nr:MULTISPECIES: pyridoxamine 5'-phosphate oxidase [unclassified Devosia]MBN9362487.1 pyridoxamine 5'-phosphate oxidase [Devosia sp.]ODS85208.1 MAG: pyridoxamine 5'-phosphate oxidase [Devosia sp. SCN 66-27]OJX24287.1 MAG: pyridoxamine 5'-phosphate oxidase [Devosia sp. 66-14]
MPATTLTERLFDDSDTAPIDPCSLFEEWFTAAQESEPNDPHAMALASVDADGMPDVRMVLLNQRDARGFCFFTNFESDKGRELLAHPKAAFVMHWKTLRRQIRVRGPVEVVADKEADAYFATRAWVSQIGAHASKQSRPLANRYTLLERVETLKKSFGEDEPVNRPTYWSGFRIIPQAMEFWKDGANRLHDRVRFTRTLPDGAWTRQRLYP